MPLTKAPKRSFWHKDWTLRGSALDGARINSPASVKARTIVKASGDLRVGLDSGLSQMRGDGRLDPDNGQLRWVYKTVVPPLGLEAAENHQRACLVLTANKRCTIIPY